MFGTNTPIWMTRSGPVYKQKNVQDKYDPVVKEVDLLHVNENYTVVRLPEGREVIVSVCSVERMIPINNLIYKLHQNGAQAATPLYNTVPLKKLFVYVCCGFISSGV